MNVKRALALVLVASVLSLGLTACSGGGFDPGGGGVVALAATILAVQQVQSATTGESFIIIDFRLDGTAGQILAALLFQFFFDLNNNNVLDPTETALSMTEISAAAEMDLGMGTSDGDVMQLPPGQTTFNGRFIWQAGADLGFVASTVCVRIAPDSNDPNQPVNDDVQCQVNYTGGNVPVSSAPVGAIPVNGRAAHVAHNLHGNGANIVVAGGNDGGAPIDNIDRFDIDLGARLHSIQFQGIGQDVREEHASSMYFDGTNVRVLVAGGRDTSQATSTADIYSFSPEMVMNAASMGSPRRRHAACLLTDNRILVTGGTSDTAPETAANTAEIFDPTVGAGGAFSPVANMPFPRADHTCTLLPNGHVLVAGGRDPASPTAPLPAVIYDPQNDVWSNALNSNGLPAVIDRYDHTATLLFNGVVAHVGGRAVSSGANLSSIDFYRTFSETIVPGGGTIPSGFTTIPGVALNVARSEHAASRLGSGGVLVSGGFAGPLPSPTLDSSEIFIPTPVTDAGIGQVFGTMTMLADSRARHTQTTVSSGSAVLFGGVNDPGGTLTTLDTIEVFQFSNTPPVASNIAVVSTSNAADVPITFDLSDAENDRSFVIARFSDDGGNTFRFMTLTDFAATVNLAPGMVGLNWNAAADGVGPGSMVIIEIVPVGGAFGTPVRTQTINF